MAADDPDFERDAGRRAEGAPPILFQRHGLRQI